MSKLPLSFYTRDDVVQISRDLLGKYLFTFIDGLLTGGIIVETEAYNGRVDKACHAHMNRRTKRTEIMYHRGGLAYVYLTYGMHHLFNVVTNEEDKADAVLIRAIEPTHGIEFMQERRNMPLVKHNLTAGPGVVCQALGINKKHYGEVLTDDTIWIEDRGVVVPENQLVVGPRIGIAYAEEDALLPWRFSIKENPWVSKAKAKYDISSNSTK